MPRPNVIVSLFPNVPPFRGVPQLRRSPTAEEIRALAIATAALRGRLWRALELQPRWGIFDTNNQQVIEADSVLALDNRNENRVSDYPVQEGAFASYNKVNVPYELVVRLTRSGSVSDRATFLQQIEATFRSLELYYILTPERTYLDVNLIRYEVIRRGAEGAYFLTEVDIFFREIRQVASQYSTDTAATRNAQLPSAVPPVNQGVIQAEPIPGFIGDIF